VEAASSAAVAGGRPEAPSLRAARRRWGESIIKGFLILAALISLLTTTGIVYALLAAGSVWVGQLVGAVPGALPALIGWAASHGAIAPGGATLFGIVFLWQIPHFMAISWLYRDDYRSAGFPMLPVVEPDGRRMLPDRLAAAGIHGPAVRELQRCGSLHGVTLADLPAGPATDALLRRRALAPVRTR